MKKSEKILRKHNIEEGIPWEKRKIIEHDIFLKHIIDNGLNHLWWFVKIIILMILGLYAKPFIGG